MRGLFALDGAGPRLAGPRWLGDEEGAARIARERLVGSMVDLRRRKVATRVLLALLGACALLLVLALGWTIGPGVALAVLAGGLGCAALVALGVQAGARRARDGKVSAELTILSERLLRLEARRAERPAEEGGADLAADVALLGRLVSGLAETAARQDAAIRALAREGAARPADPAASRPGPAEPPAAGELATREDFARAAAAIMQRLSAEGSSAGAETSREGPGVARSARRQPASAAGERPILEAVATGAFELMLQPVVTLPQRRTRIYEARVRLSVGDRQLDGDEVLPVVERHGGRSRLDLALIDRAGLLAQHLARRDSPALVSLPLGAASLREPDVIARLGRLAAPDPATARRLLIRLPARPFRSLATGPDGPVDMLRAAGVRFVLDGPADLAEDWQEAAGRGVRFVRLDAGLILHPDRRTEMLRLGSALTRAGIELVASGVDEERRIPDLLDDDVPLAIGAAIAPARPVRSDLSASPAAEAADPPAPPPAPSREGVSPDSGAPAAAGDRIPFRDVLRRAG